MDPKEKELFLNKKISLLLVLKESILIEYFKLKLNYIDALEEFKLQNFANIVWIEFLPLRF